MRSTVDKRFVRIRDDGTVLARNVQIEVPSYWIPANTRGKFRCTLPNCKYRRFSYRTKNKKLEVLFHCILQQCNCSGEDCMSCSLARPITMMRRRVSIERDGKTFSVFRKIETEIDANLAGPRPAWKPVVVFSKTEKRPDLTALVDTLPKYKPSRDRKFRVESDGTIIYEHEEGNWEPPHDINGFVRDEKDAWIFHPLWPKCLQRAVTGIRLASCGCIQVIVRCQNPECEFHTKQVKHTQCQACDKKVVE